MPRPMNDIAGKRYGSLVAIDSERRGNRVYWLCGCDCGQTTVIRSDHWGEIGSCGHDRQGPYKHGSSRTATYVSYMEAKRRCCNPRCKDYPEWGGRGIQFRFRDFDHFLDSMGIRPEGHTLGRKDPNDHYSPETCVWQTPEEQAAPGARRPGRRRNANNSNDGIEEFVRPTEYVDI